MAEYNSVKVVAASGASQTLTPTDNGIDPVFDITLTADCVLSLSGAATSPVRMQTMTLILRQDATGGRIVTLPVGVRWPAGFVPMLSSAANAVDMIQFTTLDGSNWMGFPVGFSLSAAAIQLASVGSGVAGASIPVTGTYSGTPPQAIEYSINGGVYTLASSPTITGGNFSFNFTAPVAGSYTLRVRAVNTGAISGTAAFTIIAPSVPTSVTASGSPGNAQNIITASGTANGSPITTFDVLSSSSAGGTYTKVGTITTTNPPNSGATSGNFTHTGLTNGTAYYYQVVANTAAGNVTSAATAAVTPTNAVVMPSSPVPVVRIEADQGVASDGKGGSKVTNQGSWGGDWSNPTASVAGPALSATGWDGTRPTLVYALDRWLQPELSTRVWPTGTNPFTLMAVVSVAQIIKPNTFFGAALQGGGHFRVGDDTDSSAKLGFNRQGLAEIIKTPGSVMSIDTRYLVALTYDGTTTSMFLNDMATPILTSTVQPNLTGQIFTLGHNGTQNTGNKEDMRGNMSANLVFTSALSSADRQSWKTYLISKWPTS